MSLVYVAIGIAVAILAAASLVGLYLHLVTRRIARMAERQVPAAGTFMTIDGNRIHYVEKGEGRPILLIHGLGGSLHHMRRPLMEAFGPGYRLVAPDRPGSGYSQRRRGEGLLSEHVDFVIKFMAATGLEKPLIVGHSLGGAVALATAIAHPAKVAGLALIAPLTHRDNEPKPEFAALGIQSPLMRRIIAQTVAVPLSVRNAPQTLSFVFGPQQPPADYAVEGGAMIGLRPSHFYAASTDYVGIGRQMKGVEEGLASLSIPVGVFFGTADRVLDHRKHGLSLVGKVATLDLELAEGVGHMPQYVETEKVVAFIRRIAAQASATSQAAE